MVESQPASGLAGHERRRHPRYPVAGRMSLAVEDASIGETIGIGEAADISLGGLRVRHLPKHTEVREGDRLGLLLIDEERALPLRAEVVHHGAADGFGVEFRDLSPVERREVGRLLQRIHA